MIDLSKLSKFHNECKYEKAFNEAKHLLSKDRDDRVLFWIGTYYERGLGTPVNHRMAIECYEEAAKSSGRNGHAMYRLGYMYEYGIGVYIDIEKAIKWYQRGTYEEERDCFLALERLGVGRVSYFQAWEE